MIHCRPSRFSILLSLSIATGVIAAPPGIDDSMNQGVMDPPTSQPSGGSAAQPNSSESTAKPGSGLLAGPAVVSAEMDASAMSGRTDRTNVRRSGRAARARDFFASVLTLDLERDQRPRIRRLVLEYQREAIAFGREHGPTLRSLEEKIRGIRQGDRAPDPEMIQQFQDLSANRPTPEAVQYEIWKTLTPAQQQDLRVKLKEREETASNGSRRPLMNRGNGDSDSPRGGPDADRRPE